MHILRHRLVAPEAERAGVCRLGVRFNGGLFHLVESRETSDDPPRRLSVQQT
jgi:hypothetical protein